MPRERASRKLSRQAAHRSKHQTRWVESLHRQGDTCDPLCSGMFVADLFKSQVECTKWVLISQRWGYLARRRLPTCRRRDGLWRVIAVLADTLEFNFYRPIHVRIDLGCLEPHLFAGAAPVLSIFLLRAMISGGSRLLSARRHCSGCFVVVRWHSIR